MFWADRIAAELKGRGPHLVDDMKTPSGRVHVGSLRGPILHDVIYRALRESGEQARFTFVIDDHDPFRKVPTGLDVALYTRHLGKPLYAVPSPDGMAASYARYFAGDFIDVLYNLGVRPEIIWASELYASGKVDRAIRLILDNATLVDRINHEVSGGPLHPDDWVPFNPICQQCGKVTTTRVSDWDGATVAYTCVPSATDGANGCGYSGRVSPFGGTGKLPWKQDWPAKWMALGVTVEGEGSDHSTAGGSRAVADAVARQVLQSEPPFDMPYEFLLVKVRDESGNVTAKKMATRYGTGVSARDMNEILPPELLRFLLIRPQPRQAVPFEVEGETIPRLYDEYDRCARAYFEGGDQDAARVFALSQVDDIGLRPRVLPRFSTVATWLQIPHVDPLAEARTAKGADLQQADEQEVETRVRYARLWLDRYAPPSARMAVRAEVPSEAAALTPPQRALLLHVAGRLREGAVEASLLQDELRAWGKDLGLSSGEAFGAVYLALLGRTNGPRAGWLIATLERPFVIERFELVSGAGSPVG